MHSTCTTPLRQRAYIHAQNSIHSCTKQCVCVCVCVCICLCVCCVCVKCVCVVCASVVCVSVVCASVVCVCVSFCVCMCVCACVCSLCFCSVCVYLCVSMCVRTPVDVSTSARLKHMCCRPSTHFTIPPQADVTQDLFNPFHPDGKTVFRSFFKTNFQV